MAKVSAVNKNDKRIKLSDKLYKKRQSLKKIIMDKKLPLEERFKAQINIRMIPRKYLSKLGQENQQSYQILSELVFKFIMARSLFQLQFQKIWLDTNWENFHQQELFMVIHQQIKKLNLQQRLKNKYE